MLYVLIGILPVSAFLVLNKSCFMIKGNDSLLRWTKNLHQPQSLRLLSLASMTDSMGRYPVRSDHRIYRICQAQYKTANAQAKLLI